MPPFKQMLTTFLTLIATFAAWDILMSAEESAIGPSNDLHSLAHVVSNVPAIRNLILDFDAYRTEYKAVTALCQTTQGLDVIRTHFFAPTNTTNTTTRILTCCSAAQKAVQEFNIAINVLEEGETLGVAFPKYYEDICERKQSGDRIITRDEAYLLWFLSESIMEVEARAHINGHMLDTALEEMRQVCPADITCTSVAIAAAADRARRSVNRSI